MLDFWAGSSGPHWRTEKPLDVPWNSLL